MIWQLDRSESEGPENRGDSISKGTEDVSLKSSLKLNSPIGSTKKSVDSEAGLSVSEKDPTTNHRQKKSEGAGSPDQPKRKTLPGERLRTKFLIHHLSTFISVVFQTILFIRAITC